MTTPYTVTEHGEDIDVVFNKQTAAKACTILALSGVALSRMGINPRLQQPVDTDPLCQPSLHVQNMSAEAFRRLYERGEHAFTEFNAKVQEKYNIEMIGGGPALVWLAQSGHADPSYSGAEDGRYAIRLLFNVQNKHQRDQLTAALTDLGFTLAATIPGFEEPDRPIHMIGFQTQEKTGLDMLEEIADIPHTTIPVAQAINAHKHVTETGKDTQLDV